MKKKTQEDFATQVNKVHNGKNYLYLDSYVNGRTKIRIICPVHGEFTQEAQSHMNGNGCQKCHLDKLQLAKCYDTYAFKEKANTKHYGKYKYPDLYINSETKIRIICPKHGEFLQTPNSHLCGQGCPMCKESNGERVIRFWLNENNITFEYNKTFSDCKNQKLLPFDFYLPKYNLLIEFDGRQHYFGWMNNSDNLKAIQYNDSIKTNYCKEKGIPLLRIPFSEFKNVRQILSSTILI